MKADESALLPVIEGDFRRVEAQRARRYSRPLLSIACVVAAAALGLRAPLLAAAAVAVGAAALLLAARHSRPKLVKVSLANAAFRVSGDGYDIQLEAPFRFKTGVERILATDQQDEQCFVRMVIDAHGKPLVLEEQVPAGYYPPQLDEIVGKASALGVAELTSLSPYPGALWALIEALESLTEAEPAAKLEENVESLYRIGRQQLADQQYAEAIETFSALIRQRPDSAAAYYSRGSARYHARADLDRAINDLTTALRLEPHQYKAYRMRGLARARQGDWAGLRDDCSLALQYYPNSAELHNLRGTACYRLQDFAAALSSFEEAVRLDASRHESFYNRGLAKQRQGKLADAIEDFQQALNLNPAFVEAQRNLQAARRQLARRQTESPS
ncbi:MAG: tetratricopeptide repeat protein [Chloroflexota bacterium]|nr:tetratricopeptide repeat protein [Chloroflexota bacterium]